MTVVKKWWPLPVLIVLLIYPWALKAPYYHALGFNVLLFATMAVSWNIIGGYAGYKSLGHAAFYGLGGYLVAIAANELGWDPLLSAPILALVVALVAMILGWVMLRTTGSAFVIATIAMLLMFRLVANNWKSVTNGAPGLSQPLAPWSPEYSRMPFFYYMLLWLIIALFVTAYIRRSRFGLGLMAIRDDEGKAEMVGVNTTLYKVLAFGISAYFVGIGGGIWSYSQTHISPIFAFDIVVGVEMILITMLGGVGTVWGPVVGAFVFVPLSEWIQGRPELSAGYHLVITGGLMMLILLFLPRGILPTIGEWLEERRTPREAHAGARSMAEMQQDQPEGEPASKAKVQP